MEDWQLLHTTTSYPEASIIQGMLEENEIPVRVLNRMSSSYVNLGDISIYVPARLEAIANKLLEGASLN